ncbi:MAG: hypothetical protein ACK5I7_08710, partial [Anaerotignum sp.]
RWWGNSFIFSGDSKPPLKIKVCLQTVGYKYICFVNIRIVLTPSCAEKEVKQNMYRLAELLRKHEWRDVFRKR